MFILPPTARLSITFIDRGGNEGKLSILFPATAEPSSVFAWLNSNLSVLTGISNAKIASAVWRLSLRNDSPTEPDDESDSASFLALYYRNEERFEAIFIPSPRTDLYDLQGDYAGIRLQQAGPFFSIAAELVSGAAIPHLQENGEAFPETLVVGGLAL